MIREYFRVLIVDLHTGRGKIVETDGRNQVAGGSGLAALLYSTYGYPALNWDDPAQPLIFTIGPLTGFFPLMSKTVCAFKSSYHNQYTESHGGGRAAFALFFCNLDALVIVGKAERLSCLSIGSQHLQVRDVEFMRGKDTDTTGKFMRKMFKQGTGHRSILRIGPAGEIGSSMACINVDTYRHFGRMGGGALMGQKNLKGIFLLGDGNFPAPPGKAYPAVYKEVYQQVTATEMMHKYFGLGTAGNVQPLNDIHSLPWYNLKKTYDPEANSINGDSFADETLLRNSACAGCPIGCIHIGFIREKMKEQPRYHYHQVPYDYEPIFAAGAMLGVKNTFDILRILDVMESGGIDVMSGGVALAWATEATERRMISQQETLVPLRFGDADTYKAAAHHLCHGTNPFYQALGQGTLKAASAYGGEDFACVLGQEMAGYATGELYFASQALAFRHSHLDTGAYSWDQKNSHKNVDAGVRFLMEDEPGRSFLTSMVGCLFSRSIYRDEQLGNCLESIGYDELASTMPSVSEYIRTLRWKTRIATGYNPGEIEIPKRFYEVITWKGPIDKDYLDQLKMEYGRRIMALVDEHQ